MGCGTSGTQSRNQSSTSQPQRKGTAEEVNTSIYGGRESQNASFNSNSQKYNSRAKHLLEQEVNPNPQDANVLEVTLKKPDQHRTSFREGRKYGPIEWKRGDLIGKGAYGEVFQGFNLNTGQIIAIKSVKLSGDTGSIIKEVESLKREIALLRDLEHPNIVRYIYTDISEDKSGVDILLEYVPGGSIRSLLDKFGLLDEKIIRIYTRQILQGLDYLHSRGIVHRDLKCANVLVNNDATIKLSDFGASKRLSIRDEEDYEKSKSLIGSPYWMAPEVILRQGHGSAADIWSLGCVMLEMLTGKPPWSQPGGKKNVEEILTNIATSTKPPKYPATISFECQSFLDECFLRNPKDRPTANLLLHNIFIRSILHSPIPRREKRKLEVIESVHGPEPNKKVFKTPSGFGQQLREKPPENSSSQDESSDLKHQASGEKSASDKKQGIITVSSSNFGYSYIGGGSGTGHGEVSHLEPVYEVRSIDPTDLQIIDTKQAQLEREEKEREEDLLRKEKEKKEKNRRMWEEELKRELDRKKKDNISLGMVKY